MEYRFSNEFADELVATQDYIEKILIAPQAAETLGREAIKAIEFVADNPELGLNFDERIGYKLMKNHVLRLYILKKKYLLFFVTHEKSVIFLRFLSARTDYMNHLRYFFGKYSNTI